MLCLQKRLYGDQRAQLPLVIISQRFSVRSRRKLHLSELLRAPRFEGCWASFALLSAGKQYRPHGDNSLGV